jgi:hypothetical protein
MLADTLTPWHALLDHSSGGYRVYRQHTDSLGRLDWSPRLPPREISLWLDGAIAVLDIVTRDDAR